MSVTKKKRVSKKNKLSWRKYVDIADVENFLEDQRLEERLGKPVSQKTNEELFLVDTEPVDKPRLTQKQKHRMFLQQQLPKCFSMLQSHTEVKDPLIKRNRVKTKEERKNKLLKQKEEQRRAQGILKAKELQVISDRKRDEIKRASKPKKGDFVIDLWDCEDLDEKLLASSWIANDVKKHTLTGIGKPSKSVPKSVQSKRSILPSVEPPHPGTSYNPSFTDHQDLLQHIVKQEEKIINEEKHLNSVTKGMFAKVTSKERDENWLVEMSEGLQNPDKGIDNDENEESESVNRQVQNKKKNLKQRRKQKEQKRIEQAKQIAKREKKKIADVYKLRFLKEQLDKHEKKTAVLRAKRQYKEDCKQKEPKRLSSLKFKEQEIDINLPQDITGNLRSIKKEGNLLEDRFKSLQKRNILQPTTKRSHSRAKVKRFQRTDQKNNWKVTVAREKNKL